MAVVAKKKRMSSACMSHTVGEGGMEARNRQGINKISPKPGMCVYPAVVGRQLTPLVPLRGNRKTKPPISELVGRVSGVAEARVARRPAPLGQHQLIAVLGRVHDGWAELVPKVAGVPYPASPGKVLKTMGS